MSDLNPGDRVRLLMGMPLVVFPEGSFHERSYPDGYRADVQVGAVGTALRRECGLVVVEFDRGPTVYL